MQHKRRRLGNSGNGCVRHQAEGVNHVWSYDFVMDSTVDNGPVKLLSVAEEYTRECLCRDVARNIKTEDVIETLRQLFAERGGPQSIRSDDGPRFIAKAVRVWLVESDAKTPYIEPGSSSD